MAIESVSFHRPKSFSAASVKHAEAKAQAQADRSSNPQRFMECYKDALYRLRCGANLEDCRIAWQPPLEMAAEAEALAAFRMLLSYTHPINCSCPECRQRRMERARRSKE
jgi:hypothetical protein